MEASDPCSSAAQGLAPGCLHLILNRRHGAGGRREATVDACVNEKIQASYWSHGMDGPQSASLGSDIFSVG